MTLLTVDEAAAYLGTGPRFIRRLIAEKRIPSITETLDTYGHLFPQSEEDGRGALDTVRGCRSPELSADSHGLSAD